MRGRCLTCKVHMCETRNTTSAWLSWSPKMKSRNWQSMLVIISHCPFFLCKSCHFKLYFCCVNCWCLSQLVRQKVYEVRATSLLLNLTVYFPCVKMSILFLWNSIFFHFSQKHRASDCLLWCSWEACQRQGCWNTALDKLHLSHLGNPQGPVSEVKVITARCFSKQTARKGYCACWLK